MGKPNLIDASVNVVMKNKVDPRCPNRQAAALAEDTISLVASLKMDRIGDFDPKKGLKFDVFLESGEVFDGLNIDDEVDGDILEGDKIERIQMSYNVYNRFEIKTKAVYENGILVVTAEAKDIPKF